MKKCVNVIGILSITAGSVLIIFNIPSYVWLLLLGAALVVTGIFLLR